MRLLLLFTAFLGLSAIATDTCFSPNGGCDAKLTAFMKSAKGSLDVAIYDLNLPTVTDAIIEAAKAKVKVRVVVDERQSKGQDSTVAKLRSAKVPLRYGHQAGIMHDKYTLVDGRFVELGSFNYTRHATQSNHENQLYIDHPAVVSAYQADFEKLWQTAKLP